MISKHDARIFGKAMRKSITPEDRVRKESIIENRFFDLTELSFCQTVCVYISIGTEVKTAKIISRLKQMGKRIFAPVTRGEDMYAVELKEGEVLTNGAFNIPEPSGEYYPVDKLDLIIVPMVAFNESKARIGYGKGYYDRFLPEKALSVGIAFSEQECNFEPEPFDKTLDVIITDEGVLR